MAEVAALVKNSASSWIVRVPFDASARTAQQLQARIEEACRLPPGAVERLEFQGQPLEGAEEVARVGVSVGAAGAAAAAEAVYPNGWTASALSRAYRKPLDPSWPPVRHADFIASAGWELAALAALVAASLLSA